VWDVEEGSLEGPALLPRLRDGALPTCAATISAGQLIYQSASGDGPRLKTGQM
jgi:hypothetical protein